MKENLEKYCEQVMASILLALVAIYFIMYGATGHEFRPETVDIVGLIIFGFTALFLFINNSSMSKFSIVILAFLLIPTLIIIILLLFYLITFKAESYIFELIPISFLIFCIYLIWLIFKKNTNKWQSIK